MLGCSGSQSNSYHQHHERVVSEKAGHPQWPMITMMTAICRESLAEVTLDGTQMLWFVVRCRGSGSIRVATQRRVGTLPRDQTRHSALNALKSSYHRLVDYTEVRSISFIGIVM